MIGYSFNGDFGKEKFILYSHSNNGERSSQVGPEDTRIAGNVKGICCTIAMMHSSTLFLLPLCTFPLAFATPRWMPCQNPNACPGDEPPWETKTSESALPTASTLPCGNPNACPQNSPGLETTPEQVYSIDVPTGPTSHMTVTSNNCARHCSTYTSQPRQCYQFNPSIPPYGSLWIDAANRPTQTPVYESYTCLVCLNLPAMLATPTHPEHGNSLRETQDLITAIHEISTAASIPPQLALAMALQESLGSVRPHSGDQGASRGTFQVQIPGAITCLHTPIDGCTATQIRDMVSLGICGQHSCVAPYQRPGIAFYYSRSPGSIGLVTRGYNSGSVYDGNDLTVIQVGTNSYSSDIVNRMMGRVVAGFFSRTCCARCDVARMVLEVRTCGPVDGALSDFCGDERFSFKGQVG